MSTSDDWRWKIDEAIEIIRLRYDHIGSKTGAPFLAIVYEPQAERQVLALWHERIGTLKPEFALEKVDFASITSGVSRELGTEAIVELMNNPMPGSDPVAELGRVWLAAVGQAVRQALANAGPGRPVAALEQLAALHPVTTPRALMQALWDGDHAGLTGPVVLLIPGRVMRAKNYLFLEEIDEFMYRGDIL